MNTIHRTEKDKEKVILLGVGEEAERTTVELAELCRTAGLEVVETYCQRFTDDTKYYCGSGKAEEIAEAVRYFDVNAVIADDELTPAQTGNMEGIFGVKVLDRTAVILDIFAARARSSEGKLQVELAQQKYLYSRLAGSRDNLSRLGGGIGTRGPGEKKLEVDRRHIRNRMIQLEHELKEVRQHREMLRNSRKENGFRTVALMGYTNAGKSTLLTALTGSETYSENLLFATLDTLTRRMDNDAGIDLLVTDTVGFIEKLPHGLVEAFRSTLEESIEADLLLHVIDTSSADFVRQTDIADKVLDELGCVQKKIYVYNKKDELSAIPLYSKRPCIFVSAKTGEGIEELRKMIIEALSENVRKAVLLIPYGKEGIISRIHREAKILSTEYCDEGTRMTVTVDKDRLFAYEEFIEKETEVDK